MNNDWISELKPGDKVVIESGYNQTSLHIDTIVRVTETQVITKGGRYEMHDGSGKLCKWQSINRIKQRCTEERAAELIETAKRQQLVRQIKAEATAENLLGRTTEQLEQIYKWMIGDE